MNFRGLYEFSGFENAFQTPKIVEYNFVFRILEFKINKKNIFRTTKLCSKTLTHGIQFCILNSTV